MASPYPKIVTFIDHNNDAIYQVSSAKEMDRPYDSPLVIDQMVSLGETPNQALFIYASLGLTIPTPLLPPDEGLFYTNLDYLSSCTRGFMLIYF